MARKFNGSTDYVDCGAGSRLNPAAITISSWIYLDALPASFAGTIVRNQSGALYYGLWINSAGKYHTFVYANAPVGYSGSGAYTLALGTWYRATMTYDLTNGLVAYLDSKVDGTGAANGGITTLTMNTWIGADASGAPNYPFSGKIADAAIWNVALTATEVTALAGGRRANTIRPSALIGYWPLNNVDGLMGRASDLSGYGNNGALVGTKAHSDPSIIDRRAMRGFELFNLAPTGVATAGLRYNSSLSGLGASGPFFHDRLSL